MGTLLVDGFDAFRVLFKLTSVILDTDIFL